MPPSRQVLEVAVGVPIFAGGRGAPFDEVHAMAVEFPPVPDVAAIIAPQVVEKKRKGGGMQRAAIVVGTVLILSDGSECVVVGFDAQGNPICQPHPH